MPSRSPLTLRRLTNTSIWTGTTLWPLVRRRNNSFLIMTRDLTCATRSCAAHRCQNAASLRWMWLGQTYMWAWPVREWRGRERVIEYVWDAMRCRGVYVAQIMYVWLNTTRKPYQFQQSPSGNSVCSWTGRLVLFASIVWVPRLNSCTCLRLIFLKTRTF